MYVYRNIEVRSCNLRCSGTAISIAYSVCVLVALVIHSVMCMRHVVMWCVRLYNIFPHYLTNGTIIIKTVLYTKSAFSFSLQFVSQTFVILRSNERKMIKMYIVIHVK
jgi:hypothetical protein